MGIWSFNFLISNPAAASAEKGVRGVWGGPVIGDTPVLAQSLPNTLDTPQGEVQFETNLANLSLDDDKGSIQNNIGPSSEAVNLRSGIINYVTQKGDTLNKIAGQFNISPQTILWANPSAGQKRFPAGKKLIILPVSGVLHQTQDGETWESIASLYGISPLDLRKTNEAIGGSLPSGTILVIPNGRPLQNSDLNLPQDNLPDLKNYFKMPTYGFNWGILHNYNAVDIANDCGTPVNAAQEGLVVEANDSGWNDGYGYYVLIEHPNGTKTRYAHLEKILVGIGDYVQTGQEVALMGNTGNTHGPTGCHLHFEVIGAKNPFAKTQ